MESKAINLNELQVNSVGLEKTSSKMNLSEVFTERKGSYLNEFMLFLAHFNAIPNFINEIKIDCEKANKWFAEAYRTEIKDHYFDKRYYDRSKTAELDDIFYILYDDLLVNFDTNCSTVRFLFQKTEITKVEAVIKGIKIFKVKTAKRTPKISLLVATKHGIDAKSLQITKPKLIIMRLEKIMEILFG